MSYLNIISEYWKIDIGNKLQRLKIRKELDMYKNYFIYIYIKRSQCYF